MAVKRKILTENPCKELEPIKKRDNSRKFRYYNQEQLSRMFTVLQEEPLYPLIRVAVFYGLRRSELCGLRWDSIDFVSNRLTINHTVVHMQTVVAKHKTKSKTSHRSFPPLPEIKQLLLNLQAVEAENRRLFGREYIESPYIFKWPNGKPYDPDYVNRKFVKLIRTHGLGEITLHGLRHSCASLLLAQGLNLKMVQEWLGHSDIQLTADTYGHLDSEVKRGIGEAIAGCLG